MNEGISNTRQYHNTIYKLSNVIGFI